MVNFLTDNNSDQLKEAMISESIKPESREYIINFSNSCLKRIQMSKDVSLFCFYLIHIKPITV